jgi:hypothetical protein
MHSPIIYDNVPDWFYWYDRHNRFWVAQQRDLGNRAYGDVWWCYDRGELLWNIEHATDPNNQDMLTWTCIPTDPEPST